MKNGRLWIWFSILVVAIALSAWALGRALEAEVIERPPWLVLGMALIIVVVLWSAKDEPDTVDPDPTSSFQQWVMWVRRHRPTLAIIISGSLTALNLWLIPQLVNGEDSFALATALWVAAFFVYVVGSSAEAWRWPLTRAAVQADRALVRALLLTLIGFGLRAWRLATLPANLSGDEASQGLETVRVLAGEITNPFATGWLGVPTMSFYVNAVPVALLGQTALAIRLVWMLTGVTTVLLVFLLMRRLTNDATALTACALLATYHYHIHYSRLASNQIADPLFLTLALWLLYRALDRQAVRDWIWMGAITGVAFYFYAGARLTVVVVVSVVASLALLQPRHMWQVHGRGLRYALGSALVVAAPMIQYALLVPEEFNARLNQVGIVQSGWLAAEVEIRQQSTLLILWDQFQRAIAAFHTFPDRTVWYGLKTPLLDPVFGTLLLVGMLLVLLRWRERPTVLLIWWFGAAILGGMLTESPPSSQRLITMAVPTCALIAIALVEITDFAKRLVPQSRRVLLLAALTVFSAISLNTYFIEYAPKQIYAGRRAEFSTKVAPILEPLQQEVRVYFVGEPWMYWGFATFPYLLPDANAVEVGEAPLSAERLTSVVDPRYPAAFVVLAERHEEYETIRAFYPGGRVREFTAAEDGRPLGVLYIVNPYQMRQ